jgi:hypothetical protein
MNKLINAIYDPDFKNQWDDKLLESNVEYLQSGSKNFGLNYSRNKKQMTFQSRDCYEKFFEVFHNGIYYRLSSSADGTDYALPDETVRGLVNLSVSKIERLPNGKIKLQYLTETNLFMQVPKAIQDPFLIKSTKAWYDNLKKFYTKNYKKL